MNHRLRTAFAATAIAIAVPAAGVANATEGKKPSKEHESHSDKPSKPGKACKGKGKGYLVHGLFVSGDLERVAGADTPRWNDDRYSGTVVVDVAKGNRRGRRDQGLSSYAVTGVRVIGANTDATLPPAGTRVQLLGKQRPACEPRPEPTTPTPSPTPEPSPSPTPEPEEPTATLAMNGPEEHPGGKDKDKGKNDDDAPVKVAPTSEDHESESEHADDDSSDAENDDDSVDATEPVVAKPITDVTIRVVHFKHRRSSDEG